MFHHPEWMGLKKNSSLPGKPVDLAGLMDTDREVYALKRRASLTLRTAFRSQNVFDRTLNGSVDRSSWPAVMAA